LIAVLCFLHTNTDYDNFKNMDYYGFNFGCPPGSHLGPQGKCRKDKSSNPKVVTPTVTTPKVVTPTVTTPKVVTPTVTTPKVMTPTVATPKVVTPTVVTPTVATTRDTAKLTKPASLVQKVTEKQNVKGKSLCNDKTNPGFISSQNSCTDRTSRVADSAKIKAYIDKLNTYKNILAPILEFYNNPKLMLQTQNGRTGRDIPFEVTITPQNHKIDPNNGLVLDTNGDLHQTIEIVVPKGHQGNPGPKGDKGQTGETGMEGNVGPVGKPGYPI